jgi:hypothetical protein
VRLVLWARPDAAAFGLHHEHRDDPLDAVADPLAVEAFRQADAGAAVPADGSAVAAFPAPAAASSCVLHARGLADARRPQGRPASSRPA